MPKSFKDNRASLFSETPSLLYTFIYPLTLIPSQRYVDKHEYLTAGKVQNEIQLIIRSTADLFALVVEDGTKPSSREAPKVHIEARSTKSILEELRISEELLRSVPHGEAKLKAIVDLERSKVASVKAEDYRAAQQLQREITDGEKNLTIEAKLGHQVSSARIMASPQKQIRHSSTDGGGGIMPVQRNRSARGVLSFKLVLLGFKGAGKSSFFSYLVHGRGQHVTGGKPPCFARKSIEISNGERVTVSIWDTPGVNTPAASPSIYYRDADAICLLFDATAGAEMAQRARAWVRKLRKEVGDTPVALIVNKCDLDPEAEDVWLPPGGVECQYPNLLHPRTLEAKHHISDINGTDLCFTTSVKQGRGVDEACKALVEIACRREEIIGYQVKPKPSSSTLVSRQS